MNVFEVVIILCAIAGLIMVVGSLFLLYRGVVKLGEKASGSQIEAEFKNLLKVNVRNPALGLFAIGLTFFAVALWFGKPGEVPAFKVKGHVDADDMESVKVMVYARFPLEITSSGEINDVLRGRLHEKLWYEIVAAGHNPAEVRERIDVDQASRGEIIIEPPPLKQRVARPQPNAANIKQPADYREQSEITGFYQ